MDFQSSSQQPSVFYNFVTLSAKSKMENYSFPKNVEYNEAYEPFKKSVTNEFWYASACQFIVRLIKLSNLNFSKISGNNVSEIIFDHTTHGLHMATTDQISDNKERSETQEIINIFNVLKDMYKKKNQLLTIEQIILWHSEVMVGPKRFKDFRDKWASSDDQIFVEPKEIRSKLGNLVKEFNSRHQDYLLNAKTPIYSVIAWFLHSFTLIHPFEHGNGRMALLLVQFLLFSFDFPSPVPFYNSKLEYNSILSDHDKKYSEKKDSLTNLIIQNSIRVFRNSKTLQFL
ncbi:hypothetical protein RB653_007160 [Dictyostelium firmibasis]|uniref:Fido domain-containing protein n=1 Tax=Dictyostelium firmibasis TaxID=79012 RepID=A0AAN7YUE5_9MYCE